MVSLLSSAGEVLYINSFEHTNATDTTLQHSSCFFIICSFFIDTTGSTTPHHQPVRIRKRSASFKPGADRTFGKLSGKSEAKVLITILIYKHLRKCLCKLTIFNTVKGVRYSAKKSAYTTVSFIFPYLCGSNIQGLAFMPFRNKRNSRDDKSGRPDRPGFNKRAPRGEEDPLSRDRPSGDNNRPFNKNKPFGKDRPFNNEKPYSKDRSFHKDRPFSKDKPYNKDSNRKPFDKDSNRKSFDKDRDRKPFDKDGSRRPPASDRRPFDKDRGYSKDRPYTGDKPHGRKPNTLGRKRTDPRRLQEDNHFSREQEDNGLIRLNRYIANAGICSRRKADELITAGVVSVNGNIVTELGTKVDPAKDEIRYNGEKLKREKMVYVLLNKPKDYITTTDDPKERRTVMHLVDKATRERIYPVGRLDRNTTGLLLMTNDGELAEKLSHPRNNIIKIYQVELNKSLTQGDFNKITYGLELEDGFIKPDHVSYVQGGSKRDIGIQIHSGKNRIVRRIFEHLGYDVIKLDRVVYANLTKKDLPRGRWRYLEEREVIQLKHFIK